MTLRGGEIQSVFCDPSFFYACLDPSDVHHERACSLLEESVAENIVFYSTWDIVSETATLLRYRSSYERAIQFLDHVKPTLRLVLYDGSIQSQAEEVFRQLGTDKKLSLCDALSFVVVTVLLENIPCLSFDRDFKRLGLTVIT